MAEAKNVQVRQKESVQPEENPARTRMPAVDIYEGEDGLVLVADLPGVSSDGLDVRVERDVLAIHGRIDAREARAGEAYHAEIQPADFYRAFALGEDLDAGKIAATLKNGVLTLELPKAERAKTRKIEIRAS